MPEYLPWNFQAPFVDPLPATGPAALELFSNPDVYTGASLPVIGALISPIQMVDTFTKVTCIQAAYSFAYTKSKMLHHFPQFGSNKLLVGETPGMIHYAVQYGYFQKDRDL